MAKSVENMVQDIIDTVRSHCLSGQEGEAPGTYDAWDEGPGGAGWLENEIGAYDELSDDKCDDALALTTSVDQVRHILNHQNISYLQGLLQFVHRGGTDSDEWRSYFNNTYH